MMKPHEIFGADDGRGWVPWALVTPFLGLAFVVLPTIPVSLELQRLGLLDVDEEPVGRLGFIALLLVSFGVMGLVVVAWSWLVEQRSLASIGLVYAGAGQSLGFGLLVGMLTSGGVVAAIWAAGGYQASAFFPAFAWDALTYITVLLACFVVQAGSEEILFRGWMMSALVRRINILGAIGIVSLIFTLLHMGRGTTLLTVSNTFLFSTFACCWALKARNVWGVMGWHAGWNWLIGTGFEVPVTGLDVQVPALLVHLTPVGPHDLTGGAQGPEDSVFCGLFFAAATALLVARGALSNRE